MDNVVQDKLMMKGVLKAEGCFSWSIQGIQGICMCKCGYNLEILGTENFTRWFVMVTSAYSGPRCFERFLHSRRLRVHKV